MKLKTIKNYSESYYMDRGSKFLGFLTPLESSSKFRRKLKSIRIENPKSTHVCSAYRIIDSSNIQERYSDDGEPSGSAGQSILNELKRNDMINVGAFIVRYYGGIKLGIPGLIHSYSEATRLSILNNKIVDWNFTKKYILFHTYKEINSIDSLITKYKGTLLDRKFDLFISSYIRINEDLIKFFHQDVESKLSSSVSIKELK